MYEVSDILVALAVLYSHSLIEEGEKLEEIVKTCNCSDCKEYRRTKEG